HGMVATLLSGAMRWDVRNPGKRFGDRFILSAGHANPVVYATLAVLNESLRKKYNQTGDEQYLNPMGENFTLVWEDLLTLRRRGGLPGHAEMEGKTLFFKTNTGPSGHGFPIAAGQAFALKYAGFDEVKVFAFEGEGGLTPGVIHETKNSAYGLGLGNFITLLDWNDYGIDDRKFSDVIAGGPKEWFEPYGWQVAGAENGEDWEEIMTAYHELLSNEDPHQPKLLWMKMRKGRGYYKYDNPSHGAPHKRNSAEFWKTKEDFAAKYGMELPYMGANGDISHEENKAQMAELLDAIFTVFEKEEGYLDFLSGRLIELGNSVPEKLNGAEIFEKNPLNDPAITDYKNYPVELYKKPGEKQPNRAGFGNFGSWINSYSIEKYGRPLFLVNSADLAGSTNIAGFSKGWNGSDGLGMYNRFDNPKGALMPQGITEFANAGINVGISSVNFNDDAYSAFNGFLTACSTYGSFSYLKYGVYRLYSQVAQDTQFKVGKTIWVAGHSGPETAEDSPILVYSLLG
ncbi:MAG: transketolase, partial [Simkaniaceae bacterium]|nr:transketolase [Simkaniaceae bacterium]